MSGLYSIIRRKRRPLQAATIPAPADFVCPHCGRSVTESEPAVPAESAPVIPPLVPQTPPAVPVVPVVEPVKVSKLKKSRGNTAKN
ncbi:MAG: hypothetical protein WCS42_25020 [Verrucomicrobiota bacterium]